MDDTNSHAGGILICFDGSEASVDAIEVAARLFPGERAMVASAPTVRLDDARPILTGLVRTVCLVDSGTRIAKAAGLDAIGVDLDIGSPADRIIECAERNSASLIVVGSNGHSPASTLGHRARRIASMSTRPVLVVPGPTTRPRSIEGRTHSGRVGSRSGDVAPT